MIKYIKGLVAILPPLTAVAIQLIVVNMLGIAYSLLRRLAGEGLIAGALDLTFEIEYLIFVLAVMSSGFVFIFWYRRETFGECRGKLAQIVNIRNIYIFACLALGCQFFVSGVLSILTEYYPNAFNQYGDTINSILSGGPTIVVIATVIIAPITEELIFRGVTLHIANRYIPFLLANTLQAVLFGIYHGNLVQGVYAAGLGFLFGFIYQKFETIYAPILLHMMVNASAFIIMPLPKSKLSYLILSIVGLVLVFVALKLMKAIKNQIC